MAIKTKDELMNYVNTLIGERDDDDALSMIQDFEDTLGNVDSNSDNENWKTRYQELDASWRKRYKERFFGHSQNDKDILGNDDEDDDEDDYTKRANNISINDLFTLN